jgi:timeless
MKSLKNEFRRDSVRLEDGDRVIFFRTVWFFCQWWRVSSKQRGGDKLMESSDPQDKLARKSSIGQLIFTMDVFSFNLVLNAVDTFQQHKKYARLAQAVALLSEMMHLLQALYSSKDSTDHVMALGLLDRLYYGQEPIDRLPKLLSQWEAGTSTREYLGDLLEVCHMTLKLLDINAKACQGAVDNKHDTVAKMKATAAEFDVSSYFFRKIATNHIVWMVTQLLAQYAGNPPHVNHRIVSLFLRLTKHVVTTPDERDADGPQNLLSTKTVTLEPMLYNIHTLQVFHTILNDSTIRNDKNFSTLLSFVSTVIRNFATAAESNPVLFVEALFKHPFPHRFCELATNLYVTEELRMIAERELLLEEQQRWEREAAAAQEDDEESEDEELEFTDDVGATNTSTLLKSKGDEGEKGSDDENKPAPKKSEAKDLQDSDDEGEDDSRLREKTTKSANKTKELQKRIRALNAPDGASSSSDEEDFGGESSPKKPRVFEEEEED